MEERPYPYQAGWHKNQVCGKEHPPFPWLWPDGGRTKVDAFPWLRASDGANL